ncbi:MAG: hypothetical protein JSV21_12010 [Nitrospirota bacterium]|nr:MAG: hypothetical protein JSV21_12010 [Nitrospirota bacterium]
MHDYSDIRTKFIEYARDCLKDMDLALMSLRQFPDNDELLYMLQRSISDMKSGCEVFGFDDFLDSLEKLESFISFMGANDIGITIDMIYFIESESRGLLDILERVAETCQDGCSWIRGMPDRRHHKIPVLFDRRRA